VYPLTGLTGDESVDGGHPRWGTRTGRVGQSCSHPRHRDELAGVREGRGRLAGHICCAWCRRQPSRLIPTPYCVRPASSSSTPAGNPGAWAPVGAADRGRRRDALEISVVVGRASSSSTSAGRPGARLLQEQQVGRPVPATAAARSRGGGRCGEEGEWG
jgi:hypothetical protein